MSSISGRCNSAERGSAADRRARKAWLVSDAAGWGGDGETVPCWECGVLCGPDDVDLVADRIIPGERGGTYARDNIAPHCLQCSCRQGQRRTTEVVADKRAVSFRVENAAGEPDTLSWVVLPFIPSLPTALVP